MLGWVMYGVFMGTYVIHLVYVLQAGRVLMVVLWEIFVAVLVLSCIVLVYFVWRYF